MVPPLSKTDVGLFMPRHFHSDERSITQLSLFHLRGVGRSLTQNESGFIASTALFSMSTATDGVIFIGLTLVKQFSLSSIDHNLPPFLPYATGDGCRYASGLERRATPPPSETPLLSSLAFQSSRHSLAVLSGLEVGQLICNCLEINL